MNTITTCEDCLSLHVAKTPEKDECRRYPAPMVVDSRNWCGEFKPILDQCQRCSHSGNDWPPCGKTENENQNIHASIEARRMTCREFAPKGS